MRLWDALMLAGAGLVAGALNAAGGGGSLITFPAVLVAGYPPILANVTNNIATWPGYVGGAWGYRREMEGNSAELSRWPRYVPLAVLSVYYSCSIARRALSKTLCLSWYSPPAGFLP